MTQTADRAALGQTIVDLNAAGYPYSELARKYGLTLNMVKGLARTARLKNERGIPTVPSLRAPFELTGDYMIVGDVHVPCTDWALAGLVVKVAQRLGIKQLVIGGDFFNFDLWSRFEHIVKPATWRDEREAAKVLLGGWLEYFDKVYTISGNHDQRISKWSAGELEETDVYGMVMTSAKLEHSDRGYCTITSGGQAWRVTHPGNYGRNQLTVMSDLANKYQTNIIGFHEHHLAKGLDVYGRYVVINGGMLADESKLLYTQINDSRSAAMKRGFVSLRGGVAEVWGLHPFTDWGWLD